MHRLPATQWQAALHQIALRYSGHPIVMRQRLPDEDEPHLVLWRTPLRRIVVEMTEPDNEIAIVAGHSEPFIEVRIGPVQLVRLQIAADENVNLVRFDLHDGSIAVLLFNHYW